MRKHRKLLMVLSCLAVVVGVLVFATHDNEPHYQGHSLSEWLNAYYTTPAWRFSTAPEDAVREMGTNAIPCLLQWIRYNQSGWQRTARSKLPPSVFKTGFGQYLSGVSAENKALLAVMAFSFLDTNAAPAIPHLTVIMRDTTRPEAAGNAIAALSFIDTPAVPTLTAAFADTNYPLRSEILPYLPYLEGTNSYSRYLKSALVDPDPQVRNAATNVISEFKWRRLTKAPAK